MFDEIYKIVLKATRFEELKRKLASFYIDEVRMINGVSITVAGQLAMDGANEKVEWLRRLGADASSIAQGYARAGRYWWVEAYRRRYDANINMIAQAYAQVGKDKRVEVYRAIHGADVNAIAQGYAEAGDHERVAFYCNQYDADKDYMKQVSATSLEYKLKKYLFNRRAVVDSSGTTKEYLYSGFFSGFQKSYTQKMNAVCALEAALNGEKVDLSEHLSTLRNGALGRELRAFVKFGMANALVNEKVNTVSEFIHTLQKMAILKSCNSVLSISATPTLAIERRHL